MVVFLTEFTSPYTQVKSRATYTATELNNFSVWYLFVISPAW